MSLNLPPQIRASTTLLDFYRQLREANPPEVDSFGPKVIAGTSYTPVLEDAGLLLRCTNAALVTLTVPAHAAVPYQAGSAQIFVMFAGAAGGEIVTPGTPALESALNLAAIPQFAVVTLSKLGTNLWVAS